MKRTANSSPVVGQTPIDFGASLRVRKRIAPFHLAQCFLAQVGRVEGVPFGGCHKDLLDPMPIGCERNGNFHLLPNVGEILRA